MKKVIIFGINDFAELAHYYLTNDSKYEVVAFSVNERFKEGAKTFKDLPVVDFESIVAAFPPDKFLFFAPMAPSKMNLLREEIYNSIKTKGYGLISYVSSKATVFNTQFGENCFILENNTIQPFVKVGNNVVMWSGNHIGHHSQIKNHVMFTSHVVLSGHCTIEDYCFLGVNATIRDNLILSEGTLVAMATSITKNTDKWSVYVGTPGKKLENKSSKDLKI